MIWRNISIFTLCVLAAVCLYPAEEGRYLLERVSQEQGLSQNLIRVVLQDRKGFMWFASEDGLNCYDGYDFTVYRHDPEDAGSISGNDLYTLFEDSRGVLWASTAYGLDAFDYATGTFTHHMSSRTGSRRENEGPVAQVYEDSTGVFWLITERNVLFRFDRETGESVRYTHDAANPRSIGHQRVSCILEDSGRRLWFGTAGGLSLLDRDSGLFTNYRYIPGNPTSLRGTTVLALYQDPATGDLWIGTDMGLSRRDSESGTFKWYSDPSGKLDTGTVGTIFRDSPGQIWLSAQKGLYVYDPVGDTASRYVHDPDDPYSVSSHYAHTIFQDSFGTIWLLTNYAGLNQWDPEKKRFYRYSNDPYDPLHSVGNMVTGVCEDRSGVLWFGCLDGGVSKLDRERTKFAHVKAGPEEPHNLSSNLISGFAEDGRGRLWIGAIGGGLNVLDPVTGKYSHYRHQPENPNSLGSDDVRVIRADSDGNIWAGTINAGISCFSPDTGRFKRYYKREGDPNSLASNAVYALIQDRSGFIWAGTFGGGLNRLNPRDGRVRRFLPDPGNPKSLGYYKVFCIYEDRKGDLWIGTWGGGMDKYVPDTGGFIHFRYEPGNSKSLPNDQVECIYHDEAGRLWIGTAGGLSCFHHETGTFSSYREKDGLPSEVIYGILEDADGNLWLSTNRGVSKFNPWKKSFKNYDFRDGLQGMEFNGKAFYKSKSGEMFFGGINGFNRFFPGAITDNPYVPPVLITGVSRLSKKIELDSHISGIESLDFSYDDTGITFSFAALSYSKTEKNQYAYILEGLHQDWIHLGAARKITFASLSPGSYTLRVKGSNSDGVWNHTGVSLQLRVRPPFWETWWFRTMAAFFLAMGVYGWHRLRMVNLSVKLKTEAQMSRFYDRHKLTNREQEIAQLIMKGRTNKEIEDELFISLRTVKCHIYNIYQKIGVKNRLELINAVQQKMGQ